MRDTVDCHDVLEGIAGYTNIGGGNVFWNYLVPHGQDCFMYLAFMIDKYKNS